MDTGGEDSHLKMEVSGGKVFFDPQEISASKIAELATRRALKLNESLEDAGYPKVSGVLLTVSGDREFSFSLEMEDWPSEEQKQVIASAFDGLDA